MPLKLYRYPSRSKNWRVRGTVRGVAVDETTGTADRALANAYRASREAAIWERRTFGEAATVTFLEAAVSYMEHCGSAQQKQYVARLAEHFGAKPLAEIRQAEAEDMVAALFAGRKNDTVRRAGLGPLQTVLYDAQRRWPAYTAPRLSKAKWPAGKGRYVWVAPEDMEGLLAELPQELEAMTLLRLYTGARPGEAMGLDWADLDLAHARVVFRDTKNGEHRTSYLPERVVVALANLPEPEGETDKPAPKGKRRGPVFPAYPDRWKLYENWKPAAKAAGLPDLRPHDVCHVFGSWLYHFGEADLKKLLDTKRWKDLRSVERYTHSPGDDTRSLVDTMPGLAPPAEKEKKEETG